MKEQLNIGIIGTDTSHSIAFTELLNDSAHRNHVKGGKVTHAYPGGSPDFELSISRVAAFAEEMNSRFGVQIAERPEQIAEECDAVLLLSADGRVHVELFEAIVPYGKPIFIDKPLAASVKDAEVIATLAEQWSVPVMSTSALRYAEALTKKNAITDDKVIRVDCFGPMYMEPTQTGYFWYGIHLIEMLFTVLGSECVHVKASGSGDQETITGIWKNGEIGTIQGSKTGGFPFVAAIHRERSSSFVDVASEEKPFYASLLEQVMTMFQTGIPTVDMSTTLQIIRFIEAANESRDTGKTVML